MRWNILESGGCHFDDDQVAVHKNVGVYLLKRRKGSARSKVFETWRGGFTECAAKSETHDAGNISKLQQWSCACEGA